MADPDRTLQVLSNLIENALRSTPSGGSVTVGARPGLLRVTDTGPGLAADELPHAFERFFLYTRYARHRAVGTGLGLAIVKELAEAMDGTISVQERPGRRDDVHGPAARAGASGGRSASFERFFVNVLPSRLQPGAATADASGGSNRSHAGGRK